MAVDLAEVNEIARLQHSFTRRLVVNGKARERGSRDEAEL
jgi:hypothetical protein